MLISIIVAGWRPKGVKKTIKNLDEQTYKEFEVIIVNDGNEELRKIIPDLIKDRNNYHFLDNYTRCHLYGGISRNMAIQMSFFYLREVVQNNDTDQWIMIHDDDIVYTPNFIEKIVEYHIKHPDKKMIGVNIEFRGKKNKDYKKIVQNEILPEQTDINAWAYKKELFNKYGYFPCNMQNKIKYDYLWLSRVYDIEGSNTFGFIDGDPLLIFYHKKH